MGYDTFLLPASLFHTRKSMSDNGSTFAESHKNLIDLSPLASLCLVPVLSS